MRKYHKHTIIRTPDMHPKVAGYEEVDIITGDHHITTIVDNPGGGQLKEGETWLENDTVEIFKPEVKGTIVNESPKCPACDNEFSHSVDESGTICTPDKCISTGKPIPEDTMRWMRYEMIHRNQL